VKPSQWFRGYARARIVPCGWTGHVNTNVLLNHQPPKSASTQTPSTASGPHFTALPYSLGRTSSCPGAAGSHLESLSDYKLLLSLFEGLD